MKENDAESKNIETGMVNVRFQPSDNYEDLPIEVKKILEKTGMGYHYKTYLLLRKNRDLKEDILVREEFKNIKSKFRKELKNFAEQNNYLMIICTNCKRLIGVGSRKKESGISDGLCISCSKELYPGIFSDEDLEKLEKNEWPTDNMEKQNDQQASVLGGN